ncbi:MAG: hypothetical protein AAFO07_24265 [Bacteroidota bacterium]
MKKDWNNEILANPTDKEPNEIFAAYCNEIGIYFQNKGFKYLKSRPRIEKQIGDIVISVNFWSSRINEMNKRVWLEILPYAKSKSLKKWIKSNGIGRNEFIYGIMGKQPRNLSIFGHKLEDFQILMGQIETALISQLEGFELALRNPKKLINEYSNEEGIIEDNFLAFICMNHPELAQLTFEKFGEGIEQSRVMEFEKWKKASREQCV